MMSADSPADRADQMIAVGRRLVDLIREEAVALTERRVAPPASTLAEKERLAHAWRLDVQRVRDNPGLLSGLDPARKEALKAVSREIDQELSRHALALGAMKEVTEGLIRRITEEIAAANRPPQGYGRTGVVDVSGVAAGGGAALNTKA